MIMFSVLVAVFGFNPFLIMIVTDILRDAGSGSERRKD